MINELSAKWDRVLEDTVRDRARILGEKAPSDFSVLALEKLTRATLKKKSDVRFLNLIGMGGAGMKQVGEKLINGKPSFKRLVRVTTRQPLLGEKQHIDYHFYTKELFRDEEKKGNMLAVVKKTDEWRGILAKDFFELVSAGDLFFTDSKRLSPQLFIEDPRTKYVSLVTIFLLPPDFYTHVDRVGEEIKQYTLSDGNPVEDQQCLERWLREGMDQFRASNELYQGKLLIDGFIVNNDPQEAANKIRAIF